jgi:TPP-dependent indolepyruvate ferredoxin oxidoreductase alpha subunit
MNIIKVDKAKCGGCKNCYKSCWVDVIRWNEEKKQPVIAYPEDCVDCNYCEIVCTTGSSQEAYEFTLRAIEIAECWRVPVLLRMTTRVCHSKTLVRTEGIAAPPPRTPGYVRNVPGRSMIPAHARPAHKQLREKLAKIAQWNEHAGPTGNQSWIDFHDDAASLGNGNRCFGARSGTWG